MANCSQQYDCTESIDDNPARVSINMIYSANVGNIALPNKGAGASYSNKMRRASSELSQT